VPFVRTAAPPIETEMLEAEVPKWIPKIERIALASDVAALGPDVTSR
jgi:hypothetical protein